MPCPFCSELFDICTLPDHAERCGHVAEQVSAPRLPVSGDCSECALDCCSDTIVDSVRHVRSTSTRTACSSSTSAIARCARVCRIVYCCVWIRSD